MDNQGFEHFNLWNNSAFEAMKKMIETNVSISQKIVKEQMNLASFIAAEGSKMMEAAGSTKDPKEAMTKQSAIAEETGKQILKSAHNCADILKEASETYNDIFKENIKTANEATKNTAYASKKAA